MLTDDLRPCTHTRAVLDVPLVPLWKIKLGLFYSILFLGNQQLLVPGRTGLETC